MNLNANTFQLFKFLASYHEFLWFYGFKFNMFTLYKNVAWTNLPDEDSCKNHAKDDLFLKIGRIANIIYLQNDYIQVESRLP